MPWLPKPVASSSVDHFRVGGDVVLPGRWSYEEGGNLGVFSSLLTLLLLIRRLRPCDSFVHWIISGIGVLFDDFCLIANLTQLSQFTTLLSMFSMYLNLERSHY